MPAAPLFLGSQFFSDTASLAHQVIASRETELPVFISTKFLKCNPDPAWRRQILRHARRYQHYYKCAPRLRPQPAGQQLDRFRCGSETARHRDRFAEPAHANNLSPNRFFPSAHCMANIIHRSTGRIGPYACFTGPRDDTTLMGKLAPSKFKGCRTAFFNLPSEMARMQRPNQYFRYKIRALPHRDTDDNDEDGAAAGGRRSQTPGPAHYYPQNYTLHVCERRRWGHALRRRPVAAFFSRSCVPRNDRFWTPHETVFRPGPGHYSPEAPVACPCARGTAYSAERERLVRLLAAHHLRGGRLPPALAMRPCAAPAMGPCAAPMVRGIRGAGHRSVFVSRVDRLLARPLKATAAGAKRKGHAVTLQMEHDAKYIRMITNPVRNAISLPTIDFKSRQLAPGRLRFNTMERSLKRSKLRNNKKVAFNSSTPRWPIGKAEQHKELDKPAKKLPRSPNIPVIRSAEQQPRSAGRMAQSTPAERLQWQPRRYVELRPEVDRSNKMRYVFSALPPARILVEDALGVDVQRLKKVKADVNMEDLYTEEVLDLKRQWEMRKALMGFE